MGSISGFTRRMVLASALALATTLAVPAMARDAAPGSSFTIAVIPDTQNYVDYDHQTAEGFPFDASEMFLDQLRYIAAHAKSEGGDIVFAISLGDNWQHQSLRIDPDHEARGLKAVPNPMLDPYFMPTTKVHTIEMPTVKKGYETISGKIPFGVVPGNHDYDAMWTDSGHPPAAKFTNMASLGMLHSGGLNNFRTVFGADTPFFKDKPWYVGSHDGGADSAQIFEAGGYRFLHIGLQWAAPDASLEWAASIIKKYPGVPTIVSMHDYMDEHGTRSANPIIDGHAVDPMDNSSQMIWDKLLSQHDQIFMVLCGHRHGQAMRTDMNRFGHPVYQLLSDYQDRGQTAIDAGAKPIPGFGVPRLGDGWMRLMTFHLDGGKPFIGVKTYSTFYKKMSGDEPNYAKWYKSVEQPKMTDIEFYAADDYTIPLTDFHVRFKKSIKAHH